MCRCLQRMKPCGLGFLLCLYIKLTINKEGGDDCGDYEYE